MKGSLVYRRLKQIKRVECGRRRVGDSWNSGSPASAGY